MFTTTGSWVAVAYDQKFFIGEIISVYNPNSALIQFLTRGYRDVFRWPQVDDVDTVDAMYVFAHDIDLKLANNGRSWIVPELDYLENLFRQYSALYF